MVGIEIDSTSAEIAALLNPHDHIRHEGFEKTTDQAGFDFTVGNVPFGQIRLHDRQHNPGRHTIHNHFILKSLDLTHPGGYVAVLTSRYTLDAKNPAARRDMYARADLISATRLPSGMFEADASTQVVTDLLVFRVRKPGEDPQPFTWEHAHRDGDLADIRINDVFDTPTGHVIGEERVVSGPYGPTLAISGHNLREISAALSKELGSDLARAREDGLGFSPDRPITPLSQVVKSDLPIGTITANADGTFTIVNDQGQSEALKVPKTRAKELAAIVGLTNMATTLIESEARSTVDTPELDTARTQLRNAYHAYVAQYGPLTRYELKSSIRRHKNPDGTITEKETLRTQYPPVARYWRRDPRSAILAGLERFDEVTGTATPAEILSRRQIHAPYIAKGADTPEGALAISMQHRGEIDMDYVASLLGLEDAKAAFEAVGDRVFVTPDDRTVTRAEYLSGNVAAKLNAALEAVEDQPHLQRNIDALKAVMPDSVPISDITVEIGATWISPDIYSDFVFHLTGSASAKVTYEGTAYKCALGTIPANAVKARRWGTNHLGPQEIVKRLLNYTPLVVKGTNEDGSEYVNLQATEELKMKAEAIQSEFTKWLWADPDRAEALHAKYNERFNCWVARDYTWEGENLLLPGLSKRFTDRLYPHQRTAIARMITEPTVGLFHEVGAGKTLEMVCGVMEQKRLGLINKPLVIVPNHVLPQFQREWLEAYPNAKLLVADTKGVNKDNRARFFAQALGSDWDAIICSHEAFTKIPASTQMVKSYQATSLALFQEVINNYDGPASQFSTTKTKLANMIQGLKAQLDQAQEVEDQGLPFTFDQLGVDYLVVDEAHAFKNLSPVTHLKGDAVGQDSAKRATNLDVKLHYLRETFGQRVATFATATPVANTLGEMWVMTHYLRPDLLEDTDTHTFDGWAKMFAQPEENIELKNSGRFEAKMRFSQFKNLPELLSMWTAFADVKLADDLDLPTPNLAERPSDRVRAAEVVSTDIGEAMEAFNARLAERAEVIASGAALAQHDNNLVVTHDGRTFATDDRLVKAEHYDRALKDVPTEVIARRKVDDAADNIARIYEANKNRKYLDEAGRPSDNLGALQIVFCDLGTPSDEGFNMYDELKTLLVDRGVPERSIRFVHEAKTTPEKGRLFRQASNGEIAVLIGSTAKMGTGANIQARAIAMHHLDCPWRPADLIQREGRIVRQGNQNPEVQIYRYVTARSTDAFMWQTIERKAGFISKIMRGKISGREIDNIDNKALDYAEVKAIATGNPLVLKQVEIRNELAKVRRRHAAFEAEQYFTRNRITGITNRQHLLDDCEVELARFIPGLRSTAGDAFSGSIPDKCTFTSRSDAIKALQTHIFSPVALATLRNRNTSNNRFMKIYAGPSNGRIEIGGTELKVLYQPAPAGKVSDVAVCLARLNYGEASAGSVHPLAKVALHLSGEEITAPTIGTIRKLENFISSLPDKLEDMRTEYASLEAEKKQLAATVDAPNPYSEHLERLKVELTQVERALAGELKKPGKIDANQPTLEGATRENDERARGGDSEQPRRKPRMSR